MTGSRSRHVRIPVELFNPSTYLYTVFPTDRYNYRKVPGVRAPNLLRPSLRRRFRKKAVDVSVGRQAPLRQLPQRQPVHEDRKGQLSAIERRSLIAALPAFTPVYLYVRNLVFVVD
jgi:hypothetical protein